MPTLISQIKASTPFKCKYQIISITHLVFVDASENSIMVDDVVMPLNPPIVPVEKKKLEETPLDVNVSQRSHKKNRLEEWCAFESIVCHGVVDYFLTHMP
jgi:hypothetical protein